MAACLADESVLIYAEASGYEYRVEVRKKTEQCSCLFFPPAKHRENVYGFSFFLTRTSKCEHLAVQETVLKFLKIKEKYFSCILSFHSKFLSARIYSLCLLNAFFSIHTASCISGKLNS